LLEGLTASLLVKGRSKTAAENGSDIENQQSENRKMRSGALGLLKKSWWLCLSQEFSLCEPLHANYMTL